MKKSRAGLVFGLCAACLAGASLSGCATYGAPTAKVDFASTPHATDLWIIPHDAWIQHTRDHAITPDDPWLETFRKGKTDTTLKLPMREYYALTFDANGHAVTQLFRPGSDERVTLTLP